MRFILTAIAYLSLAAPAFAAEPVTLGVKVIYAHNKATGIDPKLKKLAKDLSSLKFTAYELKDEAQLSLELGATGRVQLPTKEWLFVKPRDIDQYGKLRVDLEIEKIKLKTTSIIAKDGTLAIGGPAFQDGTLILAISREAAKAE
ncbi:MAG: hypothetical protein ACAI38_00220 [Myxococcota bacterium]|nr:hypothetical protein [Myxococcota bacterium]